MKSRSPMKVLQITDSLGMGGAETWLMEMLRLWSKSGDVQTDFLVTSGNRSFFDDEAERLGARIHYVRYGRTHLPEFAHEFRRILREGRYDAVHDHSDYASGWHFLIGLGVLPKVRVTHIHNPWLHIAANYGVTPRRRLVAALGRHLVNLLATDVCGTSSEALREYGFQPGRPERPRVQVVHCGFDVTRFNAARDEDRASVLRELNFPPDAKIILFAGRLDRAVEFGHPQNHKNSWFALQVARAALERDASVRLVMAGAGDSHEKLERAIFEWGLGNQLRLLGVRKDIGRLMRAADALLFPSQAEGLGMVAVEAQAAALPVLASTAVPRECVVIPELYDALSLAEPVPVWAEKLLAVVAKPRLPIEFCREAVSSSAFSIWNSTRSLKFTYAGSKP